MGMVSTLDDHRLMCRKSRAELRKWSAYVSIAAKPISRGSVARMTTLTGLDMATDVEERMRLWNALYTMGLAT
jgi:hypothetical protein